MYADANSVRQCRIILHGHSFDFTMFQGYIGTRGVMIYGAAADFQVRSHLT